MSAGPSADQTALRHASQLLELNRFADAEPLIRGVLASDPSNWRGWCLLGQASLGQQQWREAETAASKAIAIAPEAEWAYRIASIAQGRLGRPAQAIDSAEEAIRLHPSGMEGYTVLSTALIQDGRIEDARAAARKAVELKPHLARAHVAVGAVEFAAGNYKTAEVAFRNVLKIEPDHAAAHNELARINLRRAGGMPGAGAASARGFANALRANPNQAVSRRNLEAVIRAYLSRSAYYLFLAAYAVFIIAGNHGSQYQFIAGVVIALPVAFLGRFLHGLGPDLRGLLRDQVRHSRMLALAMLLEVVALLAMVAEAAHPGGSVIVAVLAALLARVVLWQHNKR
jgi:tetratricopeptide (TPR) repeat protein